jgi:hypothetical protein
MLNGPRWRGARWARTQLADANSADKVRHELGRRLTPRAARRVRAGVRRGSGRRLEAFGPDELPTHYDFFVNTDKLAPEHAARLIVQGAGARADGQATVA